MSAVASPCYFLHHSFSHIFKKFNRCKGTTNILIHSSFRWSSRFVADNLRLFTHFAGYVYLSLFFPREPNLFILALITKLITKSIDSTWTCPYRPILPTQLHTHHPFHPHDDDHTLQATFTALTAPCDVLSIHIRAPVLPTNYTSLAPTSQSLASNIC